MILTDLREFRLEISATQLPRKLRATSEDPKKSIVLLLFFLPAKKEKLEGKQRQAETYKQRIALKVISGITKGKRRQPDMSVGRRTSVK